MRNKVVSNSSYVFSPELDTQMRELKIDPLLTQVTLDALNKGKFKDEPIHAETIPGIDGKTVIVLADGCSVSVNLGIAQARFDSYGIEIDLNQFAVVDEEGYAEFSFNDLTDIGEELLPYVAYGMLNGGSASSYVDMHKNSKGYPGLFNLFHTQLENASKNKDTPKGLTEAYINPDGSKGFEMIELKIRALLIRALRYIDTHKGVSPKEVLNMFQMDSVLNHTFIQNRFAEYQNSPILKDLLMKLGHIKLKDVVFTASQPLLAAFTSGKSPAQVFTKAKGKKYGLVPMPRGHGHSFEVLKSVLTKLYNSGVRYYYLGNIDNMANTYDPATVAALALTGKNAAFDFSFKTKADVKGGVLIIDQHGRYTCGEIGVSVKEKLIHELEAKGHPVLFNCATGLFDLEWIITNFDKIISELPMRVSVQTKDTGTYTQVEQLIWDVIALMPDPLIVAVSKDERFLAAKMFLELLMTSGIELDNPAYPKEEQVIAKHLSAGLHKLLVNEYGMTLKNGKWEPISLESLGLD